MSQRLLLAIADPGLAQKAAALAAEGDDLEVVDSVSDPDELTRTLGRLDVDVVVLHDALGGVAPMTVARDVSAGFPEVGIVLIAESSPEVLRAAMQVGIRDVLAPPITLETLQESVRGVAQWSRAMRDRVSGEESAAGAVGGGQIIAVAGAKGGVGTTTVTLQLALAAVRAAPGRPVCIVDFDLQKGDFRNYLDMPQRRSVVDLVEVAQEISVRHLQETLYTHREGFRVLLAPDEAERYEEVDSEVPRSVLTGVKARHALTIVDLGASVNEASASGAELADQVLVVTTPDVAALRGARRLTDVYKRLQVRERDEDVVVVLNRASRKVEIQPDLARKVVRGTFARTTIPADFSALEEAVNTGVPSRLEDKAMRGAYAALAAEVGALPGAGPEPDAERPPEGGEPRGLLARLGGERGQSTVEAMGILPVLALVVLALWQMGLVGYTYMLAGHSAREGARELATDPTDEKGDRPYRERAREDLPTAWRRDAKITKPEDVTVRVKLAVPMVLPGVRSPFEITSDAATSVEDEELPESQKKTPTPTPSATRRRAT